MVDGIKDKPILGGEKSSLTRNPSSNRKRKPTGFESINNNKPILNSTSSWIQRNKRDINWYTNYTAAATCGLSFILSNTSLSDGFKNLSQKTGFFFTKVATIANGMVNADSAQKSTNPLSLIGSILEIPTAIAPGHDLWLYRGFPLFGENCQPIFSSLGIRKKDGTRDVLKPFDSTFKKPNKDSLFGDIVSAYFENAKKMIFEIPKIFKELFSNSGKALKSSPHILMLSTTTQFFGSCLALLGFKKTGAAFRNAGGIGVDAGLALHKEYDANGKPIEKKSNYFLSGITWGMAAVIDFFKRFDFLSERLSGLSELEYVIDRFASAFFADGGDDSTKKNQAKKKESPILAPQ